MLAPAHAQAQIGDMLVWAVPPQLCDAVLPHVRHFLINGYHRSGNIYNEPIMLDELQHERMCLWVAYRKGTTAFSAAMVTRLYLLDAGRGKVCHVIALGGEDMHDWIKYIDLIEGYARAEGCDTVRLEGREGWSRVLPSFVRVGVILEHRIADDG